MATRTKLDTEVEAAMRQHELDAARLTALRIETEKLAQERLRLEIAQLGREVHAYEKLKRLEVEIKRLAVAQADLAQRVSP